MELCVSLRFDISGLTSIRNWKMVVVMSHTKIMLMSFTMYFRLQLAIEASQLCFLRFDKMTNIVKCIDIKPTTMADDEVERRLTTKCFIDIMFFFFFVPNVISMRYFMVSKEKREQIVIGRRESTFLKSTMNHFYWWCPLQQQQNGKELHVHSFPCCYFLFFFSFEKTLSETFRKSIELSLERVTNVCQFQSDFVVWRSSRWPQTSSAACIAFSLNKIGISFFWRNKNVAHNVQLNSYRDEKDQTRSSVYGDDERGQKRKGTKQY